MTAGPLIWPPALKGWQTGRVTEAGRAARQAERGDRVLLGGVVDSVHDGFVMVEVDQAAPHAVPQRFGLVAVAHGGAATEAARADAALAVVFSNPCGCPERHAGTPDGACEGTAGSRLSHAGTELAVCMACALCLLAVESGVPPGRASGSASWRRRTG